MNPIYTAVNITQREREREGGRRGPIYINNSMTSQWENKRSWSTPTQWIFLGMRQSSLRCVSTACLEAPQTVCWKALMKKLQHKRCDYEGCNTGKCPNSEHNLTTLWLTAGITSETRRLKEDHAMPRHRLTRFDLNDSPSVGSIHHGEKEETPSPSKDDRASLGRRRRAIGQFSTIELPQRYDHNHGPWVVDDWFFPSFQLNFPYFCTQLMRQKSPPARPYLYPC